MSYREEKIKEYKRLASCYRKRNKEEIALKLELFILTNLTPNSGVICLQQARQKKERKNENDVSRKI